MGHALIVEDDGDASRMLAALVVREGHTVVCASTLRDARRHLLMQPPDLLLLDLYLPDGSGFELFEGQLLADTEVVLITGQASLQTSIEALRLGAADYLVKPVNPQHLKSLLGRLIRPSLLRAEVRQLTDQWQQTGRFGSLIGASEPMQRVYQQIARVAATAVTVFVYGESGTGKELVARAVHDMGRRRDLPFLAVNCGAISPHLMESEIFGHEKGSFTGAERQHLGFFERAHGGTLFLDEVTEMPVNLQVKLLRVLETGTFMRVGSTQLQQTDVRIVAATNRSAAEAVARGTLREDLFYRLNVFPIGLPPLRERLDDIPMLAESFLAELGKAGPAQKRFSPEALHSLKHYAWPGNVRELRNAVQRAWVMAPGDTIDPQWLPAADSHVAASTTATVSSASTASAGLDATPVAAAPDAAGSGVITVAIGSPLAAAERALILATYEHCGHQKERTASILGISMKTLYNRLKEYQAMSAHAASAVSESPPATAGT